MNNAISITQLREAICAKPRQQFAHLPTPLDEAPRLSKRLGVRVVIKRDDQTGLALGGNKVRKLEFLVADALSKGSDTVVTTGGSQSNHARITAAACRLTDLDCHLVLDRGLHPEAQGNMLLDRLLGANVHWIDSLDPTVATAAMDELAENLRNEGRTVYVIPRGGSIPSGAMGYTAFVPELLEQLEQQGIAPSHLYLGTGSTGTHSGVLAGMVAVGAPCPVQGISVSRTAAEQQAKIRALANDTLRHLGLSSVVGDEHILVDDGYRGVAYGHPTPGTMEAIEIAARDEGIILDPVYTGKAMAGLIGHAREGRFAPDDVVVFIHTGGAPALFAYNQEMVDALQSTPS